MFHAIECLALVNPTVRLLNDRHFVVALLGPVQLLGGLQQRTYFVLPSLNRAEFGLVWLKRCCFLLLQQPNVPVLIFLLGRHRC
jgi:hypothetical protein